MERQRKPTRRSEVSWGWRAGRKYLPPRHAAAEEGVRARQRMHEFVILDIPHNAGVPGMLSFFACLRRQQPCRARGFCAHFRPWRWETGDVASREKNEKVEFNPIFIFPVTKYIIRRKQSLIIRNNRGRVVLAVHAARRRSADGCAVRDTRQPSHGPAACETPPRPCSAPRAATRQ